MTRRLLAPLLTLVAVSLLVVGLITGVLGSLARSGLEATGLRTGSVASTIGPGALEPAGPTSPSASRSASTVPAPTGLPAPVLAAATDPPVPVAAEMSAKVDAVRLSEVGTYAATVLDAGSGRVVYAHRAGQLSTPASTMKLLTSAAALAALGAEHRFTTTVVAPQRGRIILVGGGDPYLRAPGQPVLPSAQSESRASIGTLARRTASKLKADGIVKVTLGYDASRFSGPSWNPTWPEAYTDQVSPVSALWVNEGRSTPGGGVVGARVQNPPKVAATAFAKVLKQQGIEVGTVSSARAATGARPYASVSSMTLDRIVQHVLMTSDNDGAEVLLRQAAIADGRPGSFAGGAATVRARLGRLHAWADGMTVRDGSGLSRANRVSVGALTAVLREAAEPEHPELGPLLSGLPVAGVEGSLALQFADQESRAGRGVVRGKTGTLKSVHALAGTIRTRDGSVLVYAFVVNNAENDYNAMVWLQRVTAAISTCGCR